MSTDRSSSRPVPSPTRPSSSSAPKGPPRLPPPSPSTPSVTRPLKQASSSSSKPRRQSLPFSLPPLFFQPASNTSSTSVVPSTAEGKPIPLDDSTAAHRTSALRELNSTYPSPVSRHHSYAKSSGAQSSTYSQPVIVRTYSGPSPARTHSRSNSAAGHYRPPSARRPAPPYPATRSTAPTTSFFSPGSATAPKPVVRAPRHGGLLSMGAGNAKKKAPWPWGQQQDQRDEAKLPPLEAFSFKSFMADLQAQGGEDDISADLDRIAEICARSRYSLSNQYEVHVAPHGSGASFASSTPSGRRRGGGKSGSKNAQGGPTLQAVQSDDDENAGRSSHRKRRSGGGRRRSVAYGTLETIMSSSRSSEEDKSKKKPASEIAEDVRGRARKGSGSKSAGSSSKSPRASAADDKTAATPGPSQSRGLKIVARKKSTSFANAIIYADTARHQIPAGNPSHWGPTPVSLVSEPALPQTSNSHLEIRTAPDDATHPNYTHQSEPQSPHGSDGSDTLFAQASPVAEEPGIGAAGGGLLSGLSSWVPWRAASETATAAPRQLKTGAPSHAEGSLRDLLRTADDRLGKGKGVERAE